MKFTVIIKRTNEHESRRFQDIHPESLAAQIALWLNPLSANEVEWINIYATVGVTGEPPREVTGDMYFDGTSTRETFAESNELPDPHGPHPLPDDPFQQLESGELEDLLEAITFAVMEVPREQRLRYAELSVRVDRARLMKQDEDLAREIKERADLFEDQLTRASEPDPVIGPIDITNLNNKVDAVNSASIKRDETVAEELDSEIETLESRLTKYVNDTNERNRVDLRTLYERTNNLTSLCHRLQIQDRDLRKDLYDLVRDVEHGRGELNNSLNDALQGIDDLRQNEVETLRRELSEAETRISDLELRVSDMENPT